jgi:PhnB protein
METTARINVYLTFSGNCREAMEFYHGIFGGRLTLLDAEKTGMADRMPPHMRNHVMHASLENGNLMLLGSDMGNPEKEVDGNTVSLEVDCLSPQQMQDFYDALMNGAMDSNAPHDFEQGRIAYIRDRYGKSWILYYDNTKERS